MGNSVSAESSKGQRTTQKLSKPKTSNPTAAGLLSPSAALNSARRPSVSHTSSSVTSPILPTTDAAAPASASSCKREFEPVRRLSRRLFRSNTSKRSLNSHHRSSSVDTSAPQESQWSTRENSLRNGPDEAYHYGQVPMHGCVNYFNRLTWSNVN